MVQTNQQLYDAKQTEVCDRLRLMLQSMASLAVEAQMYIGADKCDDLLSYIENDIEKARKLCNTLLTDDITCERCGAHLKKHDQEVCDDIGRE